MSDNSKLISGGLSR